MRYEEQRPIAWSVRNASTRAKPARPSKDLPDYLPTASQNLRVGELFVARHVAVGDRPDVHETGVDRAGRTFPSVPTAGDHSDIVKCEDLVQVGSERLDIGENRTEHVRNDRVASVVHASVRHARGLVPLDIRLIAANTASTSPRAKAS
jgi:hypothetical protein